MSHGTSGQDVDYPVFTPHERRARAKAARDLLVFARQSLEEARKTVLLLEMSVERAAAAEMATRFESAR